MPHPRNGVTTVPLHPVLLAVFFPLFLLSANADEWVDLSVAWLPIGAFVLACALVFVACAVLFGGWLRGGLVASLLIVLFFTFGRVRIALAGAGVNDLMLVAAWLGLAVLGLAAIGRSPDRIPAATRLLNLMAVALVAVNLAGLGAYLIGQSGQAIGRTPAPVAVGDVSRTPDIYYLVFDRYANEQTLDEFYGYDNGEFVAALEARGFTVAHDSWANYGGTALSLSSSLSMDYLDQAPLQAANRSSYGPIHATLRGHLAVPDTLTALGYEYVHIGNWWEPGETNVDADKVVLFRHESEFASALFQTTALTLLNDVGTPSGDRETSGRPNANRAHTLFEFDQVASAADLPGPTYVFAHFLVPHPPYVFNADGTQPTGEQVAERGIRVSYVEQLRWTNGRLLSLLDELLEAPSDAQPIIIVQADEGPYPPRYEADQEGFPWLQATPDEVQEKFGILNAFHLPGVDVAAFGVTDRISPVNDFRVVFNAYFDANLPLLEDLTYLSPDKAHLYDFTLYARPH
jgi:hypothetical protein